MRARKRSSLLGFYIPYLPFQIIGFFIFLTAATAEMTRPPFDMPVAEAELITGAFTEYTRHPVCIQPVRRRVHHDDRASAFGATMFLGGYAPLHSGLEFIPGIVWLLAKTATILFLLIWIRWTFPRLREDQLQKFAWKVLIPLSLVNIFVTGALKMTPWI